MNRFALVSLSRAMYGSAIILGTIEGILAFFAVYMSISFAAWMLCEWGQPVPV